MADEVSPLERKLAAILVADLVGYSHLVEVDEANTLETLKSLLASPIKPAITSHHGRIVKLMGDGLMAEFSSIVEAVTCAVEIQSSIAALPVTNAGSPRMTFRMGINLGDVVIDGDDLLGDGVNIAARLEKLCRPGSVLISGSAFEHVSGKVDAVFEYAGEQHLKNIDRAVKAYHLRVAGTGDVRHRDTMIEKPTIAVLPFENMSGDAEQTYFSDGMTEDVITELSRFPELTVLARNSSFAFRGQAADLREIGRLLNAQYVIEGSVRRIGEQIRVTAQLVATKNATHLWAERYDRAIDDVFLIQEEIAQAIVATVAQRVRDDSETAARRRRPEDMRAYDLFLQGNRLSDSFNPGAQDRAKALFEAALEIDPSFARAYTGLAFVHLNYATDEGIGIPRESDENRIKALQCAEEALALDPNDPRVHYAYGYMCLTWRDFDRAEHHLNRARQMNPNDPIIQIVWAWKEGAMGRAEQGLAAAETAFRLNPMYPAWYNYYRSHLLFQLERYSEAAVLLEQRTFDTPARHPRDMAWRAACYGHLGRGDEAKRCGEIFISSLSALWRGDATAGPAEYVDWLVDVSYLREPGDVERLRMGLRLAALPA